MTDACVSGITDGMQSHIEDALKTYQSMLDSGLTKRQAIATTKAVMVAQTEFLSQMLEEMIEMGETMAREKEGRSEQAGGMTP